MKEFNRNALNSSYKKRKVKKSKIVIKKYKSIESKQSNFLLKVINFQNSIKPE